MKPKGIGDERLLKVSELAVVYGGTIVGLRNVSLEIADGALVAVLGSNGAGKSTLLRAISNVGRRTADVGHRPSADDITEAVDARRAVARGLTVVKPEFVSDIGKEYVPAG